MQQIMNGEVVEHPMSAEDDSDEAVVVTETKAQAETHSESVVAPLEGKVVDLADVPDQVFSEKMMGDGIAIDPVSGEVRAPFNGKVQMIFPTKHAIGLVSDQGLELLIHIGLDTVQLEGQGFTMHVEEGQTKQGQQLVTFDLDYLGENAKSLITPIIVTKGDITDIAVKLVTVSISVTAF